MFSFSSDLIRRGCFLYLFQCSPKETLQYTCLLAGQVKKCQKSLLVKSISQILVFFLQNILSNDQTIHRMMYCTVIYVIVEKRK